jgi:hypothetical protein
MIVSVCISQFSLLSRNTQGLFLYKEKRLYNLLNNSVGVVLALVWFGSGKHLMTFLQVFPFSLTPLRFLISIFETYLPPTCPTFSVVWTNYQHQHSSVT